MLLIGKNCVKCVAAFCGVYQKDTILMLIKKTVFVFVSLFALCIKIMWKFHAVKLSYEAFIEIAEIGMTKVPCWKRNDRI